MLRPRPPRTRHSPHTGSPCSPAGAQRSAPGWRSAGAAPSRVLSRSPSPDRLRIPDRLRDSSPRRSPAGWAPPSRERYRSRLRAFFRNSRPAPAGAGGQSETGTPRARRQSYGSVSWGISFLVAFCSLLFILYSLRALRMRSAYGITPRPDSPRRTDPAPSAPQRCRSP